MGGRPFGFDTRSKVVQPLALKRWIQSYAAVKWQPTRSAASTTPRPLPDLVDDPIPLVHPHRQGEIPELVLQDPVLPPGERP